MSDQQLDSQEVLNIRWAYDDPNPKVRKQVWFSCYTTCNILLFQYWNTMFLVFGGLANESLLLENRGRQGCFACCNLCQTR